LLAYCNDNRIGVVPHGGNTSYCGGATPDESGQQIVLLLKRLNRIREVDPLNYSLVAEAGCILADVQRAADEADRLFPLSLGSEGTCQIGGNLSTNAGGTSVLRYGMMRELVLGSKSSWPTDVSCQRWVHFEKTTPATTSNRCSWAPKVLSRHHRCDPQVILEGADSSYGIRSGPRRSGGSRAAGAAARGQWRPCQLIRVDSADRH